MDPILRHVAACNNAVLPGNRLRLHVAGAPVGWIEPTLEAAARRAGAAPIPSGLDLPPDALHRFAHSLAEAGRFVWRDEAFDVRSDDDDAIVTQLDRGALPEFGIRASGVHLNALVERADGPWLWVARRAHTKLLDPGKLDHLVAGGIPAGLGPHEALLKEAEEEAGLGADLLAGAEPVATLDYAMHREEGLRRDRIHCYDAVLPESFKPVAHDGEVEAFELWPLPAVLAHVRETDDFKFNVNLVLIDLFRRRGLLPA